MQKFKVDENLPIEVTELLASGGHDALTVHDQKMVGVPDSELSQVCQRENRAIVRLIWVSPTYGPIHRRSMQASSSFGQHVSTNFTSYPSSNDYCRSWRKNHFRRDGGLWTTRQSAFAADATDQVYCSSAERSG